MKRHLLSLCLCLYLTTSAFAAWKAGVAKVNITPEKLMWMSGYASRKKPAEGKLHDLWAKALVLEDEKKNRVVLVTLDLVGIERYLALEVCEELEKKHKLPRKSIMLAVSHTHTGPVVRRNLNVMYFLEEKQQKLIDDYAKTLKKKLIKVVEMALKDIKPAKVSWGNGKATFAVNRRNNPEKDVPKLRKEGKLKGPIDHQVPVLAVQDSDDNYRAIVFGYACHATVLSFYQWSGDYPGFAQIAVEKAHPEAIAMFWAGCGGDQNPLPRRSVALAQKYGDALAESVEEVLKKPMKKLESQAQSHYKEIDLPFAALPTREALLKQAESTNRYIAANARYQLNKLKTEKKLKGSYPYPIQTWRLGNELKWIALRW